MFHWLLDQFGLCSILLGTESLVFCWNSRERSFATPRSCSSSFASFSCDHLMSPKSAPSGMEQAIPHTDHEVVSSGLTSHVGGVYLTELLINQSVLQVSFMQDPLSRKFAALADPTRRAMLARLTQGRASVSEIAAPFLEQMSLPAVTKHLKVLESAGLVTKTQDAQRRLCDLSPEGFRETVEFLEQYRQMWEENLDRLGAYLDSVTLKQKTANRKKSDGRKK